MTDVVTAAGPSAHIRVAVTNQSEPHSLVWLDTPNSVQLADRTTAPLVSPTGTGSYIGVVHGFTPPSESAFTVAAAIVSGFACIAIQKGTAKDWAVGSRIYCAPGTQAVSAKQTTGLVLVGIAIQPPPRFQLGNYDFLDIIIAR
jgi:hypothetical protein